MKNILQISLLLTLSINVSAQFGPAIDLVNRTSTVQDVFAVDLDGDGHVDVLSASFISVEESNIGWYQNQGDGTFGNEIIISSAVDDVRSVYAADLDNDGDMDVLSASYYDHKIAWYENLGSGVFGSQQVISFTANVALTVHAADMDGDGDMDIISGSYKLAWYENQGNGVFGSEQIISPGQIKYIKSADVDGDGNMDVIAHHGHKIIYHKNLGEGLFVSEDIYASSGWPLVDVHVNDMDGDGDCDVLYEIEDIDTGYAPIYIMEGAGDGTFGVNHTVGAAAGFSDAIYSADLDGDGDMDVISSTYISGAMVVHENIGGFNYNTHTVSNINMVSFSAGDFDNDGDDDLLFGSKLRKIVWIGSLGAEMDDFGTEHIISVSTASEAQSVYSADLDNDGDLDVLSASFNDDKIAWYENLDNGSFAAQQIISTSAIGAVAVYSSDLDGDGDMDVLSASKNPEKIAWYENLSGGAFGPEQILNTTSNNKISMSIHTSDLDGDGDTDVIYTSETTITNSDIVAWIENLGSGNFGPRQIISISNGCYRSAFSGDFDNDGDQDILSATTDEIKWFENTGSGIFEQEHIISTDGIGRTLIHSDDFDGDGDLDVLFASSSSADSKIAWYKNLGNGSFGPQKIISTSAESVYSINSDDLDDDGDVDVIIACFTDDIIGWYENLGDGNFGSQITISNNAVGARSVFAEDLDGDGDMDVLSASENDDKIAWYENTSIDLDNDQDNDGVINDLDCAPADPLIYPGAPCNDFDSSTENDVIQADCSCGNPCHPDISALISLYISTTGENWTNNSGWVDDVAFGDCQPCNWYGVTCDGNNRVIGIDLSNNQLLGEIPAILGDLYHLTQLKLQFNNLTGDIPNELGDLSQLIDLRLHNNQLNWRIPSSLGNLSQLTILSLHNNQLNWRIPSSLGNLSQLTILSLDNNDLHWEIPSELGNLSQLTDLNLHNNLLEDELPSELGNLTQLTKLNLYGNRISGCIPSSFQTLCSTTEVDMSNNPLLENDDFSTFCSGGVGVCTCAFDFNNTGFVDGQDFAIFLANFNQSCNSNCLTDLNMDGITNGLDFTIFLGNFGLGCD